jgi:hypothetical protein
MHAWFDILLLALLYYLMVWYIPAQKIAAATLKMVLAGVLLFGWYFVVVSPAIQQHSFDVRGLGGLRRGFIKTHTMKEDIWWYGVYAVFCGVVLGMALLWKSLDGGLEIDWHSFFLKYFLYLFSATLQALIFFSVLMLRLKFLVQHHMPGFPEQTRQWVTAALLALAFGMAHLPNGPLMVFTFCFAFGLCWIFYERPNLFLVVMLHAFFGAALHRIYQLHMKFGVFYGRYDEQAYFIRKIIPGLEMLIGNKW